MAQKPKRDPKDLPEIAACPSCGRRPSERVAFGWKPEFEGPTTIACSDTVHDDADIGPALLQALEAWKADGIKREFPIERVNDRALLAAFEKLRGVA